MGDNYVNYVRLARSINTGTRIKRINITSTGAEIIHTASTDTKSIKRARIDIQVKTTGQSLFLNIGSTATTANGLPWDSEDGILSFDLNPVSYTPIHAVTSSGTIVATIIEYWSPNDTY